MPSSIHTAKLLTAAERDHLLISCDQETPEGSRIYAILLLMLDCALRPGELLQFRCAAVREYDVVVSTKGQSRIVPLNARTAQALRQYRYHARPQPGQEWEQLFLASDGNSLDLASLVKIVRLAVEQAGCGDRLKSIHEIRLSALHAVPSAPRTEA